MRLDVTGLSYEARWYPFKGARLHIRPYPASEADIAFREGGIVLTGKQMWAKFNYSLVGWDGIEGADGKPLPCTEETKRMVFDFDLAGIPVFVLNTVRSWEEAKEAEEKN